jgi:hypothetical protein
MKEHKDLSRREFVKTATVSGIGFTIVPSSVMGGIGRVAPSDKINVALIGSGTQGLKQLPAWLERPELQFVSVCDPNKESYDYPLWGRSKGEKQGAPGGREIGRKKINAFYAEKNKKTTYKGCSAYVDFRELLEKDKDVDAVFIMTPDHLHATIALAAMNKQVMVGTHKPLGNFMHETRVLCETARKTKVPSQLFAFQDPKELYVLKQWIGNGLIGEVKALHRWTNRPMWPQGSPYLPTNTPSIPEGFDWDLWLGPAKPRTYSPDYTHTVFRGWYEFGAGCLADMGYYGFWKDWRLLNLGMPVTAEGSASFTCEIKDYRSTWVQNSLSYPHAATLQWEVPIKNEDRMIDVYWTSGGIRPRTPKILRQSGEGLPQEGVLFIGEKGSILADYGYRNPRLLGVKNADKKLAAIQIPELNLIDQTSEMINSFKGGKASRGSFIEAQTIAEAICLGNLAIRMDQYLEWDNKNLKATNVKEANKFVKRDSRKGWEI